MKKKMYIRVMREQTSKSPRIIFLDEKIIFDYAEDWRTALLRLELPLKARMNILLDTDEEKSKLAKEYLDDAFMSKYFLTLEIDSKPMSIDALTDMFPLF